VRGRKKRENAWLKGIFQVQYKLSSIVSMCGQHNVNYYKKKKKIFKNKIQKSGSQFQKYSHKKM